ncbi:MAG: hypothetical protein JRH20_25715, partial [Deltaproteobacteria bacterium]|nr:hypothetical protein [Deltaproteobacteria bacterium]
KMGSDAKARASKGAGGNAERPHASPESLRGQGHSGQSGKTAGSATGGASGAHSGAGAAKKSGGASGSMLRSSSPGAKGGGGAGKGHR